MTVKVGDKLAGGQVAAVRATVDGLELTVIVPYQGSQEEEAERRLKLQEEEAERVRAKGEEDPHKEEPKQVKASDEARADDDKSSDKAAAAKKAQAVRK